eukprot:scaffold626_cov337-Pavlova_lutheri.AAC.42
MKLWGAVQEILPGELIVSLPHGLKGHVAKREAGEFGKMTVKSTRQDQMEVDNELPNTTNRLQDVFQVGQLVQCVVISLNDTGKHKRIGLSLKLSKVNDGIHLKDLSKGMQIPGYVRSVEERGCVLMFGSEEFTGFLHAKDIPDDVGQMQEGKLVQCLVNKVDRKKGLVQASLKAEDRVLEPQAYEGLTLDTLIPGMLVSGKVQNVLSDGLLLNFLKFFHGTVDCFHLPKALTSADLKVEFTVGQTVDARVLYVNPSTKKIGLTMKQGLVGGSTAGRIPQVGTVIENAQVSRLDENLGLLLQFSSEASGESTGYVHISNASENHIEKIGKHFRAGQQVCARVIGQRLMDGMASLSLKKSVIEQQLVSYADCYPGMHVKGEVVAAEEFGAIVQLADGIKALLPNFHTSEVVVKSPRGKFKIGAKVRCRVLEANPSIRQIILTHKKTLVQSKLPVVGSMSDASPGMLAHGYISAFKPYGLFVTFFGGVRGLVHTSELGIGAKDKSEDFFRLGQVVKCRIVRVERLTGRLALSLSVSPEAPTHDVFDSSLVEKDVVAGEVLFGRVLGIPESGPLEVQLWDNSGPRCTGTLEKAHLSDHPAACDILHSSLQVGVELGLVLVLEYSSNKKQAILTRKQSLVASAETLPSELEQLKEGDIYPGYVVTLTETGCHVRFLNRLTGRVALTYIADTFVSDPHLHVRVGQSVRAKVLEVDMKGHRAALNLRQSQCGSTDGSFLTSLFQDMEFARALEHSRKGDSGQVVDETVVGKVAVGSQTNAVVIDMKPYGTVCTLENFPDLVGVIERGQLEKPVQKGDGVVARILDFIPSEGLVELSTKRELLLPDKGGRLKKSKDKFTPVGLPVHPPVGSRLECRVELVKDDYLVVSLPAHSFLIGFVSTKDFNMQNVQSAKRFQQGKILSATVSRLPSKDNGRRFVLNANLHKNPGKPVDPAPMKVDISCGSILEGKVKEVTPLFSLVELMDGRVARLDVTELTDDTSCQGNPWGSIKVGSLVTAVSLGYQQTKDLPKRKVYLTVRPSALASAAEQKADAGKLTSRYKRKDIVRNLKVLAFVEKAHEEWIWLRLSPNLKGRMFALDFIHTRGGSCTALTSLKPGTPLTCLVARFSQESNVVELSLEGGKPAFKSVGAGSVVPCRISKIIPASCIFVQLGQGLKGRCSIVDVQDEFGEHPFKALKEGQFCQCYVLSSGKNGHYDVSFRPSRVSSMEQGAIIDPELSTPDSLSVGQFVRGYVKSISSKGCFVTIARGMDAFVQLKNLADTFVVDPLHVFPPGTLVKGTVIKVLPDKNQVEISLRPSQGGHAGERGSLSDFQEGEVVEGTVRKLEVYGVFVSIDRCQISGLCHISEVDDEFIRNLNERFTVGDRVKAVVLKVDLESNRLSLSMKPKYFGTQESHEDLPTPSAATDELLDEDDVGSESSDHEMDEAEELSDGMDMEGGSALAKTSLASSTSNASSEEDGTSVSSSSEDESDHSEVGEEHDIEPLDAAPVVEDWEDLVVEGEQEEEDADAPVDHTSSKVRREKKRRKQEREKAIEEAEARLLESDRAPSCADDYERLLFSTPNSSFWWIKYMAHLLSLGEVDGARAIAQRALDKINYREEGEKLNVWGAWLNLESMHGSPTPMEAVAKLFAKALPLCDPKKLHMCLLGIYERMHQEEAAEDLLKTMCRKFKESAKVWLRHIAHLLQRGKGKAAQAVLDRSLLSLPRRKHLKVISQTGLLEFRSGSAERGRGIFEGILRNYPKRLDLWSVYLDQEIKQGDTNRIRSLFERAIQLDLPPKKMKFLFKRYLQYENEQGDEDHAAAVKQKAMDYVENKMG